MFESVLSPFLDGRKAGKEFCCDRCRMDGYVLRRARAMLDEVGIVEFNAILQRTL